MPGFPCQAPLPAQRDVPTPSVRHPFTSARQRACSGASTFAAYNRTLVSTTNISRVPLPGTAPRGSPRRRANGLPRSFGRSPGSAGNLASFSSIWSACSTSAEMIVRWRAASFRRRRISGSGIMSVIFIWKTIMTVWIAVNRLASNTRKAARWRDRTMPIDFALFLCAT